MTDAKSNAEVALNEEQALIRIFTSGRRARRAGLRLEDCPHAKRSPAAREWKSGWRSVGTETDIAI